MQQRQARRQLRMQSLDPLLANCSHLPVLPIPDFISFIAASTLFLGHTASCKSLPRLAAACWRIPMLHIEQQNHTQASVCGI